MSGSLPRRSTIPRRRVQRLAMEKEMTNEELWAKIDEQRSVIEVLHEELDKRIKQLKLADDILIAWHKPDRHLYEVEDAIFFYENHR